MKTTDIQTPEHEPTPKTVPSTSETRSWMNILKQLVTQNIESISRLAIVVLLFTALITISPKFGDVTNLLNILRVASLNLILATGIALCMLVTGIDLSVGAVIALSTMIFGRFFQMDRTLMDMVIGILGILAVSALIGSLNGFSIAYLGLPPFLATFGMNQVARGYAYFLSKGEVFANFTDTFKFLGSGYLAGIPMPVIFALLLLIIIGFILTKTSLGRKIYAIGSNRESAVYSGIDVKKTLVMTYMISALIAGIAGILYISRLDTAEPNIGLDFAQNAIAAAAIGGISFKGGRGNIFGIIIGALLLTLVTNGMNLLGIDSNWQMGITGIIILIGVLIDRSYARKKM